MSRPYRPCPLTVAKVDMFADAVSMLQLVNKEEGYDPMGGFEDALNDGDEVMTATR